MSRFGKDIGNSKILLCNRTKFENEDCPRKRVNICTSFPRSLHLIGIEFTGQLLEVESECYGEVTAKPMLMLKEQVFFIFVFCFFNLLGCVWYMHSPETEEGRVRKQPHMEHSHVTHPPFLTPLGTHAQNVKWPGLGLEACSGPCGSQPP